MKTLVVGVQKGGVAKSTTAVQLAAYFAQSRRVVLLDADAQGHAGLYLGVPPDAPRGFYRFLVEYDKGSYARRYTPAFDCLLTGVRHNLALVANDNRLKDAENLVRNDSNSGMIIRKRLRELEPAFDLAIIDAPPELSFTSELVYLAADLILAPVAPGHGNFAGLKELIRRIDDLNRHYDGLLTIPQPIALPTFITHENISAELLDRLEGFNQAPQIRKNVKLAEACGLGKSIWEHAPNSPGANDYTALARFMEARL